MTIFVFLAIDFRWQRLGNSRSSVFLFLLRVEEWDFKNIRMFSFVCLGFSAVVISIFFLVLLKMMKFIFVVGGFCFYLQCVGLFSIFK